MVVMISEFDSRLLSLPMESDDKHRDTHGEYPECGAIFMSSSSTKDECFRRRLFGLSSGFGHIVKQVKTGMILFLFEYEKRELHGVFQACSDGKMNIDPNAWSKSGKKFPAQVKVKPVWRCLPLSESEFGDAIRENYFSRWKFNFGLSRTQVRRLLNLFTPRKLDMQHPQRALVRYTVSKSVDTEDTDKELGDGRWASDELGNLQNLDSGPGSIIRGGYLENLPGKLERGDAKYSVRESVWNRVDMDVEHRGLLSTKHTRSGQKGRADGNLALCRSDQSISPGMSHHDTYYYVQNQRASMHQMELPSNGHSFIASPEGAIIISTRPYNPDHPGLHQMDLPSNSQYLAAPPEGAIIASTLPYYPDHPGLRLPQSLSIRRIGNRDSFQDCDGQNSIPSFRNQVFPLNTETNRLHQSVDDNSKFDFRGSLSTIDHSSFPGRSSSAEMGRDYLKSSSLAHESLSEIGSSQKDMERPSSYPLSPNNYSSFLVDHSNWGAIQTKLVHEIAPSTVNKISERRLCSDHLEDRSDVFSRLSLNDPGWCPKNLRHAGHKVNNRDTPSVDEIMAMLSESRNSWIESEKFELRKRRQSYTEKSRNMMQTNVQSDLEVIPESDTASASPTADPDVQQVMETPFVDFKRRSEVQKVGCDEKGAGIEGLSGVQCKRRKLIRPNFSQIAVRDDKKFISSFDSPVSPRESFRSENACGKKRKLVKPNSRENESSQGSSPQCSVGEQAGGKRRKLIRPNFRENGSSPASPHCSINEDDGGSCESFFGGQDMLLSQGAESSHENENIDTECFSNFEREIIPEAPVQPETNVGNGTGIFEVESGRGTEMEVLSVVELSSDIGGKVGSWKQNAKSLGVADVGMLNVQQGNCTEQSEASRKFDQHKLPQERESWSRNSLLDDASDHNIKERETGRKINPKSYLGSDKSGDLCGMEVLQVVGTDNFWTPEHLDHKESVVNRLSQDCPATDQSSVLEAALQSKTDRGPRDECGVELVDDLACKAAISCTQNNVSSAQKHPAHEDPAVLSHNCHEVSQCTVIKSSLKSLTDAGKIIALSEIKSEIGSGVEVLSIDELSPNLGDKGGSQNWTSKSLRVAENLSNRSDADMEYAQQGSSSQQLQASCKSNQSQEKGTGSRKIMLADASVQRERETGIDLESFVGSVKSGDVCGMDAVQVVSADSLRAPEFFHHKEAFVNRLSQDFPETNQPTSLELALQLETNSEPRNEAPETKCDGGSKLQVSPGIDLNTLPKPVESASNDAIDDTVKENQRLWGILTSRLRDLKNAQRQ